MLFALLSTPGVPIEALIVETLAELQWKHEFFAALLGLTPTQFSAQLNGREHPSLRRLVAIAPTPDGRIFWRAFLPKLAAAVGLDDPDFSACQERFRSAMDAMQVYMLKLEGTRPKVRRRA